MSYQVDSDWLVDYLRGRSSATHLLTTLVPAALHISFVSYGEVYEGVNHGHERLCHEEGLRAFLHAALLLPVTGPIAQRSGRIRENLRARGLLIGDADLLIAPTALEHDLTLVTRNIRHFDRISDLRLYPPPLR